MDRIQASQKLRRWPEFVASVDQTIVHTAGNENLISGAISSNYIRICTSTEEEDFIPDSIDNTTLYRTPTLPTPPKTSPIQIVNTIWAEAVAKLPAITTLANSKLIITGNSSSAILSTLSFRRSYKPSNHKIRGVHLSHQSIQRSFKGTRLS